MALTEEPSINGIAEPVPPPRRRRSVTKFFLFGCLGLLAAIIVFVVILAKTDTSNDGGKTAARATPETTSESTPETPKSVVIAFYNAISREDFTTAWSLLSPAFQNEESFDKFKEGYATTQSVSVSVADVPGAPQRVRASLDAVDLINGNSVRSHFDGFWILRQVSHGRWLLDSGHFSKSEAETAVPSDARTEVSSSELVVPSATASTEATDSTPEATESAPKANESGSDLLAASKAFEATNASQQANCQELAYLIATPEQRKTDPKFAESPLQYGGGLLNQDGVFEAAAVIDAGKCLDDVRTETSDDLPAEYPIAYLRGACQNVRAHLASDQVKMFFADAKIDAAEEVEKYCKSIAAWK